MTDIALPGSIVADANRDHHMDTFVLITFSTMSNPAFAGYLESPYAFGI